MTRSRERYGPDWQFRTDGSVWIDHATVMPHDLARLADVRVLTLWNVRLPDGFLAQLSRLWWLDLRGGSATDLRRLVGCRSLRYLQVNQVRGLRGLSVISSLDRLEFLSLYGLAQVEALPSLAALPRLRRVEVGQMRRLGDLSGLAAAPALEELFFQNRIGIAVEAVAELARHPSLREFGWWAPDEPRWQVAGVIQALGRPPARILYPEHWFAARGQQPHSGERDVGSGPR